MLFVSLNESVIRLILTISERMVESSGTLSMVIYSPFTKRSFNLELPENSSAYPNRYDEFIISKNDFPVKEEGIYQYTVYDSLGNALENGSMKVLKTNKHIEGDSYISPSLPDVFNDFLVFDKERG